MQTTSSQRSLEEAQQERAPDDPQLLYDVNPKVFKDYKSAGTKDLNHRQFIRAVKEIPYLVADKSSGVTIPKGEYLDENVLANALKMCGLTIRDLVGASYKTLEGPKIKPPTLENNTCSAFIKRVEDKMKNPTVEELRKCITYLYGPKSAVSTKNLSGLKTSPTSKSFRSK